MDSITNIMYGQGDILKYNQSELDGEIKIPEKNEQLGEINVQSRFKNIMRGNTEIIVTPKQYITCDVIYDTFIRSSMPTMSYGTNQGLYVGKTITGDEFKSLIKFDLSKIPNNMVITKANMTLNCIDIDNSINLDIYSVNDSWQENNITWLSYQNMSVGGKIASTNVKQNDKSSTIDITNYIQDCYNGNIDNNGFVINSIDSENILKGFYSKESMYSPKLLIEYYDPSIKDISIETFNGEINVSKKDNSSIQGEIDIKNLYSSGSNDLDGELIVSCPTQYGEINIKCKSDIDGELVVYYRALEEIGGEIVISHPEQLGEIIVSKENNLDGEINIYHKIEDNIQGEINVYHQITNEINGEIIIGFKDLLDGEINIYKKENDDLNGELTISCPEQLGELLISKKDEIDGEINIYHKESNTLNGEIAVYYKKDTSINGELLVGISSNIDGEINVYHRKYNDINGEINIKSPNELLGEILIPCSSNIDGEIKTAIPYMHEIDGEIEVGQNKFIGYTFIM